MRNNIRTPQISRTIYTRDTVIPQIAPPSPPSEEPIPVETPTVTDETIPNVQLPTTEPENPATGNSK